MQCWISVQSTRPSYWPRECISTLARRYKEGNKDLDTIREQVGRKNNHRVAHINGVPAYAHSFLLFILFFFVLSGLFCTWLFVLYFFTKVSQKHDITQEYQKTFAYVRHNFFSLTSTDSLIDLETSIANTSNMKVVGVLFLFILD
jgi:hypothetical protein